jgi:WD40 repeat protein
MTKRQRAILLILSWCWAITKPALSGEPIRAEPAMPLTDRFGDPLPDGAVARLGTMRWAYPDDIGYKTLTYSPDGRMLAVGDWQGRIHVFDAGTGRPIKEFRATKYGRISSLSFSADARILVSGTWQDGDDFRVWDPTTGKLLAQLENDGSPIAVAFSPTEKLLATAPPLRLWNMSQERKKPTAALEKSSWGQRSIAFSHDGKLLALARFDLLRREIRPLKIETDNTDPYPDHTVSVRDVRTGKELSAFGGNKWDITSVAFSPDGKLLACATEEEHEKRIHGRIVFYDPRTGKPQRELRGTGGGKLFAFANGEVFDFLAFSPDGKRLAAAGFHLRMWDLGSGKELWRVESWGRGPFAFSPDGKKLARLGAVRVMWLDAATGENLPAEEGHQRGIHALRISPDGKTLATAGGDRVRLWDVATQKQKRFLWLEGASLRGFGKGGETLYLQQGSRITEWHLNNGWDRLLPDKTLAYGNLLIFADGKAIGPDGRDRIAPARADGDTLTQYGRILAFSPDSKLLVARKRDTDQPLWLWDFISARQLRPLADSHTPNESPATLEDDAYETAAFAPNGSVLAAVTTRGVICFWDVASGALLCQTPPAAGRSLCFSPDGRTLASGGPAGEIRLWEVANAKLRRAYAGPLGNVSDIAFFHDGKTLATAHQNGTVLIWDLSRGRP